MKKDFPIQAIILIIMFAIAGWFTGKVGLWPGLWWVGAVFNFILSWIVIFSLPRKIGFNQTLFFLFVLAVLAWSIESVAIQTCVPYGCFDYGTAIGPRIMNGLAPLTLPLAVWPLVLIAYETARQIFKKVRFDWRRIIVADLILIVMDLVIDPLAVRLGLWRYQGDGGWFGVPWQNFGGWLITGAIFMLVTECFLNGRSNVKSKWAFLIMFGFWIGVFISLFP